MSSQASPFCSQPWSTLYVQWDGKVTRPCIRGPQNLGSLDAVADIREIWNGTALRAVRESIVNETRFNAACRSCHAARSRTIDHITCFGDNIGGDFGYEKVENYYTVHDTWRAGSLSSPSSSVK